jgi:hypothetical protein
MTPQIIVTAGAVILSLVFEYIPGIYTWHQGLGKRQTAALMAGLMALVVLGAWLLSCYGPYDFLECDESGAWSGLELYVLALIANQTTYQLARKPH